MDASREERLGCKIREYIQVLRYPTYLLSYLCILIYLYIYIELSFPLHIAIPYSFRVFFFANDSSFCCCCYDLSGNLRSSLAENRHTSFLSGAAWAAEISWFTCVGRFPAWPSGWVGPLPSHWRFQNKRHKERH